jgi:hypothetical protein
VPAPTPANTEPGPTAADCDQLLDHAIALTGTPLTDDDRAKVRTQLQADFSQQCLAMTRATYGCAMTAASMGELAACDQRTPSNSTSNSSVAPGGMTPAAPRSP